METIAINIILCLVGLAGLFLGGERLVTGSVATAKRLYIKPQLIAITIVALGTSLPELFVSVNAVTQGAQGIAWGNVVGSNISNLLCVLGIAAIVTPLVFPFDSLKLEVFWFFLSCGILVFSVQIFLTITVWGGAVFIALLIGIIFHVSVTAIRRPEVAKHGEISSNEKKKIKIWIGFLSIAFGGILLIGSAELVVFSSKKIAERLMINEAFIGLTVIALGTSLPEVAASIVAAKKGHSGIAIGNVIGSNIFNSLGIIGAAAVASGSEKFMPPESFERFDIRVMLVATVFLSLIFLRVKRIGRFMGIIFVCSYLVYVYFAFRQI